MHWKNRNFTSVMWILDNKLSVWANSGCLFACLLVCLFVCLFDYLIVFNATFNNISVISWRSVLLVEETEDSEKTIDLSQVADKLYHIMLYTSPWSRYEPTTSVVIGTDCIVSFKSNYHTITATTIPQTQGENWRLQSVVIIIYA
jgi:hypothetical protein